MKHDTERAPFRVKEDKARSFGHCARLCGLLLAFSAILCGPATATPQTPPPLDRVLAFPVPVPGEQLPPDRGAAGAWHRIGKLTTTASILHITAHPDDEHSGMLTLASRGWGARTALLSLNRGEAGANAIGPELFDALGLIRTRELVLAGRYYGLGRPLLHHRHRLRLLQVGRRGVPQLEPGSRAGRHGPGDPPESPDRGGLALPRDAARRSRSSSRSRSPDPGGRGCRGRSGPVSGADHARRAEAVARAASVPRRGARGRAARRGPGRERLQPVAGHDLPALGQPRAEPAAVADFGADAGWGRAGISVRADRGWGRRNSA